VDLPGDEATFDRLIELGAVDAERQPDGTLAALMPDSVAPEQLAGVLGVENLTVSAVPGRDAGSVWVLDIRPVQIGRLRIIPAAVPARPGDLRLVESAAFGTGLHPTTRLCLEILDDIIQASRPQAMLDVGTGSGILALAALRLGVPRATGIDIDAQAIAAAAENARVNQLDRRLRLATGGPDAIDGTWPLVVANVLAAPLIEMAPALVRRVGHHGHLVLSGIPSAAHEEVGRAYRQLGMRPLRTGSSGTWTAQVLSASW